MTFGIFISACIGVIVWTYLAYIIGAALAEERARRETDNKWRNILANDGLAEFYVEKRNVIDGKQPDVRWRWLNDRYKAVEQSQHDPGIDPRGNVVQEQ